MTGSPAPTGRVPIELVNPYKGLVPFEDTEVDALFFFGREREVAIIAENLLAARLTVLYGPTGVGKTSVLRAGVAHHIRQLARANLASGGHPEFAIVLFDGWSAEPVATLRAAARTELAALFGSALLEEDESEPLADTFERWTETLACDLLLVLDQAEEYFMYHREDGGFADELPELVTRPRLRVRVLLSIREDALARLDRFRGRIPGLFGNSLRLDHLGRRAARGAIVGPVERYNALARDDQRVAVEDAFIDAVLEQTTAGSIRFDEAGRGVGLDERDETRIEAPYLQLVLERVWEEEIGSGSRTLRLATLESLGGTTAIVRSHLRRAVEALPAHEQDVAAGIFRYLITPSGTKVAHETGDLAEYAGVDPVRLEGVLAALGRERILRPVDGAARNGRRYEIFHDILGDAVLAWRREHELANQRRIAERRHRRIALVAIGALVALVAMVAVAIFALTQRSQARTEARRARARELAATAISQLSVDPQESLRRAVEAAELDEAPEVENALRQALLESRLRHVFRVDGPVATVSFSPAGTLALVASHDGRARIFEARAGRLIRVLDARGPMTSASFSADGRLVVASSEDHTARIWRQRTGSPLRVLPHPVAVTAAAFSPDGAEVATVAADHMVRIWRVRDGRLIRSLKHEETVRQATFSPNGELVLTVSGRDARVFVVRTGRRLHEFEQRGGLTSASFSPDGSVVATTSRDRTARLWDARTGQVRHVLADHFGQVTQAAFSPRGRLVVTACTDGAARIWRVATGAKVAVLPGHSNDVLGAGFSPDGRWVITWSRDRTAKIWLAASGRLVASLLGHSDGLVGAAYASSGDLVVTGSEDGTARIWDPGTEGQLRLLGRHRGSVSTATFSRDGKRVVSASDDGSARIWTVSGHHLVTTLRHGGPVTSAVFSPDGGLILTTSRDGKARLWEGDSPRLLIHGGPVTTGAISSDGRYAVTASLDGTARVWQTANGEPVQVLRHGAAVRSASFSPDGRLVVTGGDDDIARIWNARRGAVVHVLRGHRGRIVAASFSPDGRMVLTASDDDTARIWSASGKTLHVLRGHSNPLTSASFSRDSKLVVTSSVDSDARIWSVATGKTVHVLRGHFAVVNGAAFSPDERWVVTAGPGTAGLWPTETGRLLAYLFGHSGILTSASFSPDGRRVLTSGEDGTVRLYDCTVCPTIRGMVRAARARLAASGDLPKS
jgi:WD40 repeat protein